MATIKDIAQRTGLGLATISKYINGGNVRPRNKQAIDAAIAELRYTVNYSARSLKTNRSMTVGAVIPELNNVFITTVMGSVTDVLRRYGYGLMLCGCRSDARREAEAIGYLLSRQVDGILNMPFDQSGAHLLPALEADVPVVLVDRTVNALRARTDSVLVDNVSIAAEATQALLDAGHTRIGLISGPSDVFTSQQRLLGYHQAHVQSGLMADPEMVIGGDYSVQGGHDATARLLARGATALFATNYEMTLGAIIAMNDLGVRMPTQLSFVGFDNIRLSEVIRPRLTIVEQPMEALGEEAAKLLLARLGDHPPKECARVMLPARIAWGDSIAPPAP